MIQLHTLCECQAGWGTLQKNEIELERNDKITAQ